MKVLITGAAGYIGKHVVKAFLNAGHEVVVVDNLCNSSKESLKRVKKITGKAVKFYKADIRDERKLDRIVAAEAPFDARVSYLDSNGTSYVDTGIVVDRYTAFSFRFAWQTLHSSCFTPALPQSASESVSHAQLCASAV